MAGAAASAFLGLAATAKAEPLKIAMIEALSGPAAQTGIMFTEGMRYGVARLNEAGGFGGEPIQLLELDNQGGPIGAADKLKAAIAAGARIVSSASSSAVAAQITEDVRKYNLRNPGKEIIYYNVGSEAFELTAERCHFWFFRMSTNPFIRIGALVKAMKERGDLGGKVYSINQNYSFGVDMQNAQAEAVKAAGSTVVEAVLHDVNKIQDFSPYVAKIKASGADTVLTGNWANDVILLLKAVGDAGLKVKFGTTSLDTPGVLSNAGPSAEGAYMAKNYVLEAGGDAGKALIEDYKKRYGDYPSGEQPTSYFAMMLLGEALKTIKDKKGDTVAPRAIVEALETVKFETPIGPWSIRKDDHQLLMPVTISQVSKDGQYKHDGTPYGFKLIKVVAPQDAAVPVSPACKMQRPS
jgi:branched-chain amino acid transport system substrate-binding protein